VVAHHQNAGATQTGDGDWRPDAWYRPEFWEPDRARAARALLDSYLSDTPVALAHIGYLVDQWVRPGGRAADRPDAPPADLRSERGVKAVHIVALWLDEVLYGQGREQFHREEWPALQLTADSMARADFCRMDFRALVSECLERGVTPAPISSGRSGRPV